jgi:membrane protease YdiL (CAAX protease family)
VIPPRPDLDDRVDRLPDDPAAEEMAAAGHDVPWRWWHAILLYVGVNIGAGLAVAIPFAGRRPSGGLVVGLSLAVDLILLAVMVVWLRRVSSSPARDVGLPPRSERIRSVLVGLVAGVGIYVAAAIVQVILVVVLSALAGRQLEPPAQVPDDLTALSLVAQVILAVAVAPVAEEVFFRGLLFRSLRRHGFVTAALISGLLFGAVHLVGAPSLEGLLLQLPLAGVGVALAWLAERRGLTASIGAHVAFNLVGLVLILWVG